MGINNPPRTLIGGNTALLLGSLKDASHLVACKFCHQLPCAVGFQDAALTIMTLVKYRCDTTFHAQDMLWKRRCTKFSWITAPIKRHLRYYLYYLLTSLDKDMTE